MTDPQLRVGEQRPGGRASRVRASVLGAAAELLSEVGYEKMSIEDVAVRAGVHKTTVYRRWPTKAELIVDAVRMQSDENVPIPDTGTILGDLQALASAVVANIGSTNGSRQTRAIVAAAATSDELSGAMHLFWADRFAASLPVVERAIERGELPPGSDAKLIIETLIGPIWVRFLLTGEPIEDDFAQRVAEFVTAGATQAVGDGRPE